jgi:adenine-specific DNA methylase
VNGTAEYDLQLGVTVHIGAEEYEIYSFDESAVVLQDPKAPLFTREMPRAEFDRKLRENRLNDELIKPTAEPPAPEPETPPETADTPRVLYKRYLPKLLDEILQGELHSFLRDEETEAPDAEAAIGDFLDVAAESGDYPGLSDALDLPDFRDWLTLDILDRTYQDVATDGRDGVTQHEADPDCPGWAKRPELPGLVREELSLRGFAVSDELIAEGISEYRAHGGRGDAQDAADFIEDEYLIEEPAPEPEAETEAPYIPQPGDRYEIQGRFFVVDSVDADYETVSLRDVTFEGNTGFPIFRSESFEFIRMYDPVQPKPPQPPAPRKIESGVNFPGEIFLRPVHIPRPGEEWYLVGDTVYISNAPYEITEISAEDGAVTVRGENGDLHSHGYQMFDALLNGNDRNKQLRDSRKPITPAWEKEREKERGSRANVFDPHPEIPQSERHNFRITDDDLGAGGAKTKFRNNIEAVKTLQTVERENRFATPEEQEILSRYIGWGALPQAFNADNKEWAAEYAELKELLSPEEYDSARATTLNAHYTSPTVIKAIYKAVENMGFRKGNILEPSCGIGNFFGLVPESMADSKLFGVELDSLTGRIARQLYQKNSIAIWGFEKTELPDSFFDLAIGNVPFGSYGVSDKRYDKHKFHIHDYFFARTLDKVRPGGIIAFVTSKGTMDKQDPSVRKYIARRADLLGAIRLPMTAFKANAGTEVTADIIFLQKRDRITDIEPNWVHLGTTGGIGADGEAAEIPVNSYFAEHPDMILGTMSNESGGRMYGSANETYCIPFEDADLAEQLDEAITGIHAEITEYERDEDEQEADNSIPADPNVRNYSYTVAHGQIYYRQDSRMVPALLPVTAQNRVKGLIEIRECVRNLIMYQTDDYPEHAIAAEQAKLNRLYDNFTRKYGLINSRGNSMAFSQDNAYCLLCSLEVLDENGELERKADMFTKRTIKAHVPITHVDTATEALAASMGEKARVDLSYMSELTGMDEETLKAELAGLIFLNVGGAESQDKTYVTADEYLSGDIREKLAWAKAAQTAVGDGSLDINVQALEAALPEDLTAAEIAVRLGATWFPEDVVQQFMYELLGTSPYARNHIKVHYCHHTGEWNVTEKTAIPKWRCSAM